MGAVNTKCCACEDDGPTVPDDNWAPVRRLMPNEFTVVVDRTNGATLGISACPNNDSHLEVTSISPGLIADWNDKRPPGSQDIVRAGDKIVEVNGRSGSAMKLIGACREARPLQIVFSRQEGFTS
eukprot:TRINITY_DN13748_c0_g2_i1.p1 TRINITY_DN13748_c0_g2~~TRINITY_DN13748_c0_g2_i1.p1  ORF type:complete len:125 (+),score=16.98 TRINITY_DN13748_c0_g2_i1:87-461(+)